MEIFTLPDPGEGLREATIVAWLVAPGDQVSHGQVLCEVETAKSLVEIPSPRAGEIAELLAPEGTEIPVGSPLVRFAADAAADADADADADTDDDAASADAAEQASEGAAEHGATLVGYGVREDVTGRVRRRRAYKKLAEQGLPSAAEVAGPAHPKVAAVMAKPPVRALAKQLGIELSAVRGSGPGGLITREDVESFRERARPETLAIYPGDDEPWLAGGTVSADGRSTRVSAQAVRRRTAEAMVRSAFSAPHVTEFHTVDVTATMELVARLRQEKEFAKLHITPLIMVMRALILAIRRHPEINASWDEERAEIVYKHYVNLGIAAATPRGLVVPNIKDAHRLTLKELAEQLGVLIADARAGRTTPAAQADGTITITNVGAFGIDTGTPILNPGEAAILAFGAIKQRPWVVDGEICVRWVTELALSFDHRLVDGALGSLVLADVATILEDPARALVWG